MFVKPGRGKAVHVALLSGHALVVPPEGREIPQGFAAAAMAAGCVPAETSTRRRSRKRTIAQEDSVDGASAPSGAGGNTEDGTGEE